MFERKRFSRAAALATIAGLVAVAPAKAEDTVKVGLILPMTGGQASTGKQIENAIKLYMQQKGDTVAGKKIEIILKDDAAIPDKTKTAAQELIVNDKVNFIAGFGVTPGFVASTRTAGRNCRDALSSPAPWTGGRTKMPSSTSSTRSCRPSGARFRTHRWRWSAGVRRSGSRRPPSAPASSSAGPWTTCGRTRGPERPGR